MPQALPVFNITRGFRLRLNQARKAVENCSCAWVVPDVSVRDLTLAESMVARAKQAKDREPLPYAEVFGLRFEAPVGGDAAAQQSRLLAYEASLLVGEIASRGVSAQ